jgi:carbon-monoxide dehydrogenase small subunit
MAARKIKIKFNLNGEDLETEVQPNRRLLDFLREDMGLTGTKEGCGIGECGACTVLLNNKAVNSCLVLACQVNRAEILTIEGELRKTVYCIPFRKVFFPVVQCSAASALRE